MKSRLIIVKRQSNYNLKTTVNAQKGKKNRINVQAQSETYSPEITSDSKALQKNPKALQMSIW